MKEPPQFRIFSAATLIIMFSFLGRAPAFAQSTFLQTGTGTNRCLLILNFPDEKKVAFQHRWNGISLNAKNLLESVIAVTGGELMVSTNDYITPFPLVPMTNPLSSGLVVHYQGSYEVPFINAIRWNGPDGPVGADYQDPDNWWHLWVTGPAHIDQTLAWPDPLPPLDLSVGSSWFFGENSGLADLTLSDGASVGLVYGTTNQPTLPAPTIRSVSFSSVTNLQIQFSSVPGARYQLETRSNLTEGTWTPLGAAIVATATNTTVTTAADHPADRSFYRLGVLP